jgi:hypothetical protein
MKNVKLYLHSKDANMSGKTGVKRFYIKDISRGSPYSGTTKLSVETIVVFNTASNLHGTYVLEMDQIQNYSYDSNLDDNSMVIGVVTDNKDTLYHPRIRTHRSHLLKSQTH